MRVSTLRATSPVGILMTLAAALLVSTLVLFGRFEAAPRVWGGLAIACAGLMILCKRSRSQQLTLSRLDQFTWAVLISHTVLVARVRDPHALADEQGLTVEIALEISIWCLCLAYAAARVLGDLDRVKTLWGPGTRYATLLFAAAVLSTLYSASPSITLAWSLKLLAILVVGAALFDPKDPDSSDRFISATTLGLMFMLGQFIVLGMLAPTSMVTQSTLTGIWRAGGILLPATQLAAVAGMASVLSLTDILARRKGRYSWLVFAGSSLLMVLSLGRGGMMAAGAGIVVVLVVFRRLRLAVTFGLVLGVVFLATPSAMDASWDLISRRQQMSELTSLTGRVPLWWKSIELILEKPLLGWGYVSGSRVALLTAFQYWPASHSHNFLLEILLTLGIVGCVLLLAMICKTIIGVLTSLRSMRIANPTHQDLVSLKTLVLVVFLLTEGMLNAGFSGAPRFEAVILIGCTFCADHLRRRTTEKGG